MFYRWMLWQMHAARFRYSSDPSQSNITIRLYIEGHEKYGAGKLYRYC